MWQVEWLHGSPAAGRPGVATGAYTIEAEFGGFGAGVVTLQKTDGSEVKLPIEKLSEEDQQWIRGRGR